MPTSNQKPLQKQMYIIAASCWKCKKSMSIALMHGNTEINSGRMYGPESFSQEEIKLAKSHDVTIRMHHSEIRQEDYKANTCPHCGTFAGQHYLFEYFTGAEYGDYAYKKIDLE